jgi:hypothetical protein
VTGGLFNSNPQWAYKSKRSIGVPSWVPATVGDTALVPMTNTIASVSLRTTLPADARGSGDDEFFDFSGGVYNPYYGDLGAHVVHGGGHAATQDNSVFIANFNTLLWELVGPPVVLASKSVYDGYITTGAPPDSFADTPTANPREIASEVPGSCHTYDNLLILPPSLSGDPLGALIRPVASAIGQEASRETGWSHVFPFTSETWDRWSTNAKSMGSHVGGTSVLDTLRNRIWAITSGNVATGYLTGSTRTWTSGNISSLPDSYPDSVWSCYVAHRDIVLIATRNSGQTTTRFYYYDASGNGETRTLVTFTGGNPAGGYNGSLVYVPDTEKVVFWSSQDQDNYVEIDLPSTLSSNWTKTSIPITGSYRPSLLSPTYSAWTYKRMDYAPQLKSLVWVTGCPELSSTTSRVVCIRIVA